MSKTKSPVKPSKAFNPRVKIYFPDRSQHAALAKLAAENKAKGKKLDTVSKLVVHAALMFARRPDNVAALRKAGHSVEALFV